MYQRTSAAVRHTSRVEVYESTVSIDGDLTIHVLEADGLAAGYATAAKVRDAFAEVAEGFAARMRADLGFVWTEALRVGIEADGAVVGDAS